MQKLFVSDVGDKFPIVMVHGFLGSSIMWEPQVQELKKYYRVITPDLPGFGYSGKLKPYNSINSMAKSILDLIDQKNINKFHLLGHSMGGMIVQEMTKLAGEKIENQVDTKTQLPIISLYGKNRKPTSKQLQEIEIMIFDLQDVGVRFFTYLSTLHYVMEACAENNIPLIVLDRPNPNTHYIDGPVLDLKNNTYRCL